MYKLHLLYSYEQKASFYHCLFLPCSHPAIDGFTQFPVFPHHRRIIFNSRGMDLKNIFFETINRIQAISLVHEKLYQSQNLSQIIMKNYVEDLSILIINSYTLSNTKIHVHPDIEEFPISIDIAIPCGIVINELLTNSLKHAFNDNSTGNVTIKIKKNENIIHIEYSDNGKGVPDDFDFRNADTIGLKSIIGIIEYQLHGKVDFDSKGGFGCKMYSSQDLYNERI